MGDEKKKNQNTNLTDTQLKTKGGVDLFSCVRKEMKNKYGSLKGQQQLFDLNGDAIVYPKEPSQMQSINKNLGKDLIYIMGKEDLKLLEGADYTKGRNMLYMTGNYD